MKKRFGIEIPERRWTATVKLLSGELFTTTVYGPNVSEAERLYKASIKDIDYIAIHSEQMT